MEQIFFFLFGVVAGMAFLPHLQRLKDEARRRLAEFDEPSDPWSRL